MNMNIIELKSNVAIINLEKAHLEVFKNDLEAKFSH